MNKAIGFFSGLVFGWGLILSGMTQPRKVKAFLDLAGAWDPSLALVMGAAIAVGLLAFARAKTQKISWVGANMEIPNNQSIDTRLLLGGALFGMGWGLAGFCPGPAWVAMGSGVGAAGIFVAAMLLGMVVHDKMLARA